MLPDFRLHHKPLPTGARQCLGEQWPLGPSLARVEPVRATNLRLQDSYVAWQDTARLDPACPERWSGGRAPRAPPEWARGALVLTDAAE